jgi:hypothetical protein
MTTLYDMGDVARVTVTFTLAGTPTDPTTVALKIQNPNKVETTYTWALAQVTRTSAGIFYKDISLNVAGEWFYRWEGTGAVESASENSLFVSESEFD